MQRPDDTGPSIIRADVFMNALGAIVVLLGAMILYLTAATTAAPVDETKVLPPGNVIVHISWPAGDTDVDLWVDGPGEPAPVGYSNKGGMLWNLLRDDLGNNPDTTPLNYEDAFARGIVAGEYVVNVHCYRCSVLPVPVDAEVSVSTTDAASKRTLKVIASARVVLYTNGQERTAMAFRLLPDGTLAAGSLNNVFQPLRSVRRR